MTQILLYHTQLNHGDTEKNKYKTLNQCFAKCHLIVLYLHSSLEVIHWLDPSITCTEESSLFVGVQCSLSSWFTPTQQCTSPQTLNKILIIVLHCKAINQLPMKLHPHEPAKFWPRIRRIPQYTPCSYKIINAIKSFRNQHTYVTHGPSLCRSEISSKCTFEHLMFIHANKKCLELHLINTSCTVNNTGFH